MSGVNDGGGVADSGHGGRGALRRLGTKWRGTVACVAAVVVGLSVSPVATAGASPASGPLPVGQIPNPFVSGHAGNYGWGAATLIDGSVVIGDIWNHSVEHFAKSGADLGRVITVAKGEAPYGLAVDPRNDTIYVCNQRNGCEKWTTSDAGATYTYRTILVPTGANYPSRAAVADDGTVYITDMLTNRITAFNGDANPPVELFHWGTRGKGPGQFAEPRALAFDAAQHLYVLDAGNSRVQVFDRTGAYLAQWGRKGTGPGDLHGTNCRGLAIDRVSGMVYIVDIIANTVHKFSLDGTTTGTWRLDIGTANPNPTVFPPPGGTFSAGGREDTVDGDGNIWVGDMPDFRTQKFSPSGQFLLAAPDLSAPALPPTGAFNAPTGVGVDSQGNTIVVDSHNFRLQKLDPAGNLIWSFGQRGKGDGESFNYARMVSVDRSNDSFYLADTYSSAIKKFDKDGNFLWSVGGLGTGPGFFTRPAGVGVGLGGTVWVADSANHRIQAISAVDGHFLSQFTCTCLSDPRGVAADAAGNVYVADTVKATLLKFSSTGTLLATVATRGTGPTQLVAPSDVVVDASNVYISDSRGKAIKIFSLATGAFVSSFVGAPLAIPDGIDIAPNGRLYVSDNGSDRVTILCVQAC